MQLPLLAKDKANHYIAGNLAGLSGAASAVLLGCPELAGVSASLTALSAGLVKELIDWLANRAAIAAFQPAPHSVEPADVLATWLGGLQVHAALYVVAP